MIGSSTRIATAQSIAASYTTPPIDCTVQNTLAFVNTWTGTPTGTFSWQGCNDQSCIANPGTANWVTLAAPTVVHGTANPAGSGSANGVVFDKLFAFMRQVYTASSGAGTLTVDIAMKST